MTQVRMGFEAETIRVSIQNILPTRLVHQDVLKSVKYQAILASIRELGIVEPLAVHPEKRVNGDAAHFILLDGHLRLEALKELGETNSNRLVVDEVSVHTPADEFGVSQQSCTLLPGNAVQLAPNDQGTVLFEIASDQ